MFCPKCGEEMDDDAIVCAYCKYAIGGRKGSVPNDAPSIGFAILGFWAPVVGLILYLVYKNTAPMKARSAGKGALIRICIPCVILVVAIFFGLIMSVLGI